MIRGTTPTHTFNVYYSEGKNKTPFNVALIGKVKIIYAQADKVILTKHTEDCNMKDGTISVTLTQEETFLFDSKKPVQIQVRVLTTGGQVVATNIKEQDVGKCLEEEVLG